VNNFEEQLRASLQRREPSGGFAERVQLRVQAERRRHLLLRRSRWFAAAAILLVASGGFSYWQHERRVQAEGEMARAEVMQALQISSEKLNLVLKKINHIDKNKEKP